MILSLIFGFIAGIFIGSTLSISSWFFVVCIVLASIFFVYRYFVDEKRRLILTFAVLIMLGIVCGIGRIAISNLSAKSQLDNFVGQKVSAMGIIVDEPDERESNVKLTVAIQKISVGIPPEQSDEKAEAKATTALTTTEKVLVTVPLYPQYNYGDKVNLNLVLEKPKEIDSPDGRVFDYNGYLRVRGIWYTSRFTQITSVESGHGAYIQTALFKIKHAFTNAINQAISQPESSLMVGLLLGTKQTLGKDLLAEFQRAGVSHVVVLSGYNIAIVAKSVISLLSFLPKGISFGIGTLSIILFTILSGGGASAWRAAIMVLVALFAKQSNREYKADRAFGLAIVVMLLFNPLLLVFDPSFQLSVLATIGLIFVSPFVLPYLTRIKNLTFKEIISSTIATQIVVLPYLIYTTGILSLVSLPVNILILGTVPLTMLLGFITGMIGIISLYISFIPAFFAYILLWYQLTVVHIGATLPFGAVTLPVFSPIILILVYLIIFALLYFLKKKTA